MARNLEEILNAIDTLEIYEHDYVIIKKLIASCPSRLFTKILEEVLDGNLYWSDFEEILSNTNYPKILTENFETQHNLLNILKLRKSINLEIDPETDGALKIRSTSDTKYFDTEYETLRSNILYNMTLINKNDTELEKSCKLKLYKALTGGDKKYNINKIDPSNIMLFLTDYILPVIEENQVLDDFDRAYMRENNISLEEMKHIKSLKTFLKQ